MKIIPVGDLMIDGKEVNFQVRITDSFFDGVNENYQAKIVGGGKGGFFLELSSPPLPLQNFQYFAFVFNDLIEELEIDHTGGNFEYFTKAQIIEPMNEIAKSFFTEPNEIGLPN